MLWEPKGEADTCSSSDEDEDQDEDEEEEEVLRPVRKGGDVAVGRTPGSALHSPLAGVSRHASCGGGSAAAVAASVCDAQHPAPAGIQTPAALGPGAQLATSRRGACPTGPISHSAPGRAPQGTPHLSSARRATAAVAPGLRFTAKMMHPGPRMPQYSATVVGAAVAPKPQTAGSPASRTERARAKTDAAAWPARGVPGAGTATVRAPGGASAAPGSHASISAGVSKLSKAGTAEATRRTLQAGQCAQPALPAGCPQANTGALPRPQDPQQQPPCPATLPSAAAQNTEAAAASPTGCVAAPPQPLLPHASASAVQPPVGTCVSHGCQDDVATGGTAAQHRASGPMASAAACTVAVQGVNAGMFVSPKRSSQGVNGGTFVSPTRSSVPPASWFILGPQVPVVVELPDAVHAGRAAAMAGAAPQPRAQTGAKATCGHARHTEAIIAAQPPEQPPMDTLPIVADTAPTTEGAAAAGVQCTGAAGKWLEVAPCATQVVAAKQLCAPVPLKAEGSRAVQAEGIPTGGVSVADQRGAARKPAGSQPVRSTAAGDLAGGARSDGVPVATEACALRDKVSLQQHESAASRLEAFFSRARTAPLAPEAFFSLSEKTPRGHGAAHSVPHGGSVPDSAVHAPVATQGTLQQHGSPARVDSQRSSADVAATASQDMQQLQLLLAMTPKTPQQLPHTVSCMHAMTSRRRASRRSPTTEGGRVNSDENVATGVNGSVGKSRESSAAAAAAAGAGAGGRSSDRVLRTGGVEKAWNLNEEDTDDSEGGSDAMSLSEASAEESDSESDSESDDLAWR